MKVYDLIYKLHEMAELLGDVEVKTYSEAYCCDLHKIEAVKDKDSYIGICIGK